MSCTERERTGPLEYLRLARLTMQTEQPQPDRCRAEQPYARRVSQEGITERVDRSEMRAT